MAAREEIREGMWEFILEVRQYLCNTEFAPEPFTNPVDLDILKEMGNTQLKKMDSQGVVIKVESELPKKVWDAFIEHDWRDLTPTEIALVKGMLKAGYTAWDPLI